MQVQKVMKQFISKNYLPFERSEFISNLTNSNLLSPTYAKFEELRNKFGQETTLKIMGIKEAPKNPDEILTMLNHFMSKLNLDRAGFLQMYVATDTVSTLKLVEKMAQGFWDIGVYTFFDCLTLSGMALLNMHNYPQQCGLDTNFFVNLDKETYDFIHRGMVGGVSSSLNRLAIKGHTKIRPHQFGNNAKTVQNIKMFDLNSLYTNVIGDELSSTIGFPMTRLKEDGYKIRDLNGKWPEEYEALSYMAEKYPKLKIQSFMSPHGQKHLYLKQLKTYTPLDGFIPALNIAISYHGCLFHACKICYPDKDYEIHPIKKDSTFAMVRMRSDEIDDAINKTVKEHIIIRECQFKKLNYISKIKFIQQIKKKETLTEAEMITKIKNGEIHGFVEADLDATDEAIKDFIDFPPLFIREKITINDLDDEQRNYALKNNLFTADRESVGMAFSAKSMVLSTELLRFYLENNIVSISNVNKVVEFRKEAMFKDWRDNLLRMRTEAENKGEKVKSLLAKALGNQSYGQHLLNILKRPKSVITTDEKFDKAYAGIRGKAGIIETPRDVGPKNIQGKTIEIIYYQALMKSNTLVQIGVEILNNAKKILLQWYKNFIIKYMDPMCFMPIATDTDSYMIAFAHEKLEDNVKEGMLEEFRKEKHKYLIPDVNDEDYEKLRCAPGRCKIQVDDGIAAVALNSKCYAILTQFNVVQTNKGISDKFEENRYYTSFFEKLRCLLDPNYVPNRECMNRMIQYKDDEMKIVSQNKRSLSRLNVKFSYCKQKTCGISKELFRNEDKLKKFLPYKDIDCNNTFEGAIAALANISTEIMQYLMTQFM